MTDSEVLGRIEALEKTIAICMRKIGFLTEQMERWNTPKEYEENDNYFDDPKTKQRVIDELVKKVNDLSAENKELKDAIGKQVIPTVPSTPTYPTYPMCPEWPYPWTNPWYGGPYATWTTNGTDAKWDTEAHRYKS